ncbi:cation-translocating P-type ATPase [Spirosoma koreense]
MDANLTPPISLTGLTDAEAEESRVRNGINELPSQVGNWQLLKNTITEPMFGLLAATCTLYWLLGELYEGVILCIAMFLVAGLSVYESVRSNGALQALRQLTQPTVQVKRNTQFIDLPVQQVVVGDVVWLTEGQTTPADGLMLQANDCFVDESILTGEAMPVPKTEVNTPFYCGTTLTSGQAFLRIAAVGIHTEIGKLGDTLQHIVKERTPLQQQIHQFVSRMALIGLGVFLVVWAINYTRSGDWLTSLLFGLTMAMTILPEEIPVAFSSFMALGAVRLSHVGVLAKQPQTVESLGAASVICVDKTGTITQEGMTLSQIFIGSEERLVTMTPRLSASAWEVLACARWASEPEPFDSMEQAIVSAYLAHCATTDLSQRTIVHEYPLSGTPPMMTHVYEPQTGSVQVAGKGAVERILHICRLTTSQKALIQQQASQLSTSGYRVLGVAASSWNKGVYPTDQDDFAWSFKGLLAFENPPKPNAHWVIEQFRGAGILVKLITGDYPETALAIARQVGLASGQQVLTGSQVLALSEADFRKAVTTTEVFARMSPQAKLCVIQALKANGHVVAMTGDGVNDGPALKAAHIGVAMGKRGTELAKQAASLILATDDLASMVNAIALGRRIYQNLKKAVAYIVSIHIPIILTITVPLLANWHFTNLFNPIHIIFLELIMGPTCSIAFEQEPAEKGLMRQKPRPLNTTFFTTKESAMSLIKGLWIASTTLGLYYGFMRQGYPIETVRVMTFSSLVLNNIGLTLVSRSGRESLAETIRNPNRFLWLIMSVSLISLSISLLIPGVRTFMQFAPITATQFGLCILSAFIGTFWIEAVKWRKR